MNTFILADQLDQAIDLLIAQPDSTPTVELDLGGLLGVAAELRFLPSPQFKVRLKADLMERARVRSGTAIHVLAAVPMRVADGSRQASRHWDTQTEVRPALFATGSDGYPARGWNFAVAFLMQAAAVALFASSGLWLGHRELKPHVVATLIAPGDYALPPAPGEAHGGGGGGDSDKLRASKGNPPRFSSEQLTPPMVVVRNSESTLVAEPTVVGPPNVTFPQTGQLGDPLSAIFAPLSNGTGSSGGIGTGRGDGVGSGEGPGVGYGKGGGIGGGVYRVGGSVMAPRPIYDPDPEYSEEARKARHQGSVVLWVVVGPDGRAKDIRVARSLGMGLDEKAMETVRTWRFAPATKDGQPVAVQVNIEVDFRLY